MNLTQALISAAARATEVFTEDELEEFADGYRSGRLHNPADPLCRDNLFKAKLEHGSPKVAQYWAGYLQGAKEVQEAQSAPSTLKIASESP